MPKRELKVEICGIAIVLAFASLAADLKKKQKKEISLANESEKRKKTVTSLEK